MIAVYGTLRKGMSNYKYFRSGLEYVETVTVPGFKLYDIGLPVILPEEGEVVCDLMEVTNPYVGRSIDMMELRAGYYIIPIKVNGHPCKIYPYLPMSDFEKQTATPIPNGNFIKWTHSKATSS